ncbi:amino acid ABC transporter substrate-binding protein (PAAT family) [Trinickia symbiotica]|uniref:ABC transporter substrate-binding protein n=1 Tax=Trinickia symbiotica TaxID=863227 RepID=A0A2N7X910_9BURK|nr:ABC transporter substrate-binding protein [Trinickia symbiotica]PMS38218.1 ABC transporter substrate-binding protein [Trinickia symbiotica]PPK47081.1 amino acid ABC transporter substrate-binding protein (PAAT family) [Trinickia symbiotica]
MNPGHYLARRLAPAFFALALGASDAALAAHPLDLSPQQVGRVRAATDAAAIGAVPQAFPFVGKDALTVGVVAGLPPLGTYATDAKTLVGFDPDLSQLVADGLGRKLKIVALSWPDWPLALQSGKVDAVIANVTVTEERKDKFDFSTYRRDQLGFYVASGSAIKSIREPKDIAGLRVITDAGTNQEKILLEWDKENVARGLKPVQVQYYDDAAVRTVALLSGRADVILSVNALLAYEEAQQGKIRSVGAISGGWPRTAEVAIATRKGSGLAAPLTILLNDLIEDGKYRQVLERWNLDSEALERAQTNPPGLPKT